MIYNATNITAMPCTTALTIHHHLTKIVILGISIGKAIRSYKVDYISSREALRSHFSITFTEFKWLFLLLFAFLNYNIHCTGLGRFVDIKV